ncbi:MAG: 4Fe-4S dicluster domain-containing protein [Actinobacteria bacterium]|nr:4Fe-4S dicluster domain-containing protein [Actinomycetota bacterium]
MGTDTGAVVVDVAGFDALLALLARERRVLGPVLADGVIGIGEIAGVADLPAGWTDEQAPGRYRAVRRDDDALFGYAVGQRSWRTEVNPSRLPLLQIRRRRAGEGDRDGARHQEVLPADPRAGVEPTAWVGVRGCDLAALAVSDRVLLGGEHPDPHYAERRRDVFVVAVDCTSPASTCFCPSMGTGPAAAGAGHPGPTPDLHVHEVCTTDRHELVCRPGTDAGRALLAAVAAEARPATAADETTAAEAIAEAARRIDEHRHLDAEGLAGRLEAALEHPRWDDVAERCLSCANCTLVCPTCFCSTVETTTDLAGTETTRTRVADSCFTLDHSYLHGGSVHASTRSRYRQWLTHKLDTWWDQFGTSGCTGCGRCTTWCPVGIDLVEEATAIAGPTAVAAHPEGGPS